MSKKHIVATADCETDPFVYGRVPKPFVWGFYSEESGYENFWGNDSCTTKFVEWLHCLSIPHTIYVHNGGRFDFFFLLPYLEGSLKIVNGRILECHIGIHTLRDSYAAVPIPLSAYKKDDIDYTKLESNVRNKHRAEILKYLRGDVVYLHEMMTRYRAEFGDVLTIGTAAMRALKKHHSFETFDKDQDAYFRQFYYGGRCQCFRTGWIEGEYKVYDVNSMYPYAMLSMEHPVSNTFTESTLFTDKTDFVIVEGRNFGALPLRTKTGGLDFTSSEGTYHVSGHELRAALDTGSFEPLRIIQAIEFSRRISFSEFVDSYYSKRLAAKEALDDLLVLFYKLILNSGYGKFCLNPENFADFEITAFDEFLDDPYQLVEQSDEYNLWAKPSTQTTYFNVATGASITGAARSMLLRGLAKATSPIYCDTDSIICKNLEASIDSKTLGAWKHEATGDAIAIAGKKLYALYKDGAVYLDEKGKPKQASKGARLTGDQIRSVALGQRVAYENPVPAFKLSGEHQFIKREIGATGGRVMEFPDDL